MYDLCKDMRANGKKSLLPCQKGILVSIVSLKKLASYLFVRYSQCDILTSRLNQDCLENFFSQIRAAGRFDTCPTSISAKFRIRSLLLSSGESLQLSKYCNVQCDDESLLVDICSDELSSPAVEEQKDSEVCLKKEEHEKSYPEGIAVSDLSDPLGELKQDQAFKYVAGYVAFKLAAKVPNLGSCIKS